MTGEIRLPPAGEQPAGGGVQVAEGGSGGVPAAGMQTAGMQTAGTQTADMRTAEAELAALQAQVDERTADLQRISAEYSNYRRRVERDRQLVIVSAKAQVAGELLTVLDDIERAQQHGDLSGPFKAIADKLVAGLVAQGLEPFGAIGDGFDPDVHEAVQHSTSPDVHGPTVTTVLRRGYRLGERVLRPAMVAVTDTEPPETAETFSETAATAGAATFPDSETFPNVAMPRDAAWSGGAEPSQEN